MDRAVRWTGRQERRAQPRDGAADDARSLLVREAARLTAGQPDGDGQPHAQVLCRAGGTGARRRHLLSSPAGTDQARPSADRQLAADDQLSRRAGRVTFPAATTVTDLCLVIHAHHVSSPQSYSDLHIHCQP